MNRRDDRPDRATPRFDGSVPQSDGDALQSDRDALTGELHELVQAWKRAAAPLPPHLESRIRGAVQAELSARALARERPRTARTRRGVPRGPTRWAAAAAVLLITGATLALTGVLPFGRQPAPRHILVADALRAAERAEREHALAIAQLEAAALPILARADDPQLPAAQVATLLAYRDRLRALDSAITEIHGILEHNAGHAGARTYLLAAYMDKTQLLRAVLALRLPTQSGTEGRS